MFHNLANFPTQQTGTGCLILLISVFKDTTQMRTKKHNLPFILLSYLTIYELHSFYMHVSPSHQQQFYFNVDQVKDDEEATISSKKSMYATDNSRPSQMSKTAKNRTYQHSSVLLPVQ